LDDSFLRVHLACRLSQGYPQQTFSQQGMNPQMMHANNNHPLQQQPWQNSPTSQPSFAAQQQAPPQHTFNPSQQQHQNSNLSQFNLSHVQQQPSRPTSSVSSHHQPSPAINPSQLQTFNSASSASSPVQFRPQNQAQNVDPSRSSSKRKSRTSSGPGQPMNAPSPAVSQQSNQSPALPSNNNAQLAFLQQHQRQAQLQLQQGLGNGTAYGGGGNGGGMADFMNGGLGGTLPGGINPAMLAAQGGNQAEIFQKLIATGALQGGIAGGHQRGQSGPNMNAQQAQVRVFLTLLSLDYEERAYC
jgi:hypothetical protein